MPSYYSIIKYLPDPISEEAMNIGVAVFGGGVTPRFRFISDWTRARQFGGESTEFLEKLSRQLSSRQLGIFEDSGQWNEDQLRRVLGKWHNSVQFTSPRASLRDAPALLDDIAGSFLREAQRKEIFARGSRLTSEVRGMFRRMKVLGKTAKDVERHRVVTDFKIDKKTGLYAEFAVKNGAYHVIETIDYRSSARAAKAKFYETGAKALVLSEAKEKLGRGTKTYVVYSARQADRAELRAYLALLDQHTDAIFNFENKRDAAAFGSSIKKITGGADLAHAAE
jgi:hypothetical protein